MDSVLCLTEFTLHLCNVPFRRKLYGRETSTNISFKMGGEKHARLFKFQQQVFVLFYDVLKRSCLFLIVLEMLTICLYMLFLEPFMYTILFYYHHFPVHQLVATNSMHSKFTYTPHFQHLSIGGVFGIQPNTCGGTFLRKLSVS